MDNFCRYADGKKLDRYNEIVPFLNIGWYEVGERHPFFHSVSESRFRLRIAVFKV